MKHYLPFLFSLIFLLFACDTASENSTETESTPETVVDADAPLFENNGIKLYAINSPKFEDASLALSEVNPAGEEGYGFDFEVKNYELGTQTEDAEGKGLANSAKGQHIHFIVDNGPYSAHYEAGFEKALPEGHHVILAFLSRSYHESVKNTNAYVATQVTVGKAEAEEVDLTQPHLFYSRPKGTYTGAANIERVMLDFYLLNVDLSKGGYTVSATINDTAQFELDSWQPYAMEGLSVGTNTINLKLKDSEGNLVDSPFNDVTRTIILEETTEVN